MTSANIRSENDLFYVHNVLPCVFAYLHPDDLIACSQVCKLWKEVVENLSFWTSYRVRLCDQQLTQIQENVKLKLAGNLEVRVTTENVNVVSEIMCKNKHLHSLVLHSPREDRWTDTHTVQWTFPFGFCTTLTSLNVSTCHRISLDDLTPLTNLKDLYVDCNFELGFFKSTHKYLENLVSFGVGYSNYHEKANKALQNLYNQQLTGLLITALKNIKALKLCAMDEDFSVLDTLAQCPGIKTLTLELTTSSSNYSAFLSKCSNVHNLVVKTTCHRNQMMNLAQIATRNDVLLDTVSQLRPAMFRWIFESHYLRESEQELSLKHGQIMRNYTVIHKDELEAVTLVQLQDKISELLLNRSNVSISDDKNEAGMTCDLCPNEDFAGLNLKFLRILRKDRWRAQWFAKRLQNNVSENL